MAIAGMPLSRAIEVLNSSAPPSASSGAKAWACSSGPRTLTANCASNSPAETSDKGWKRPKPALKKTPSRRGATARTASARALAAAGSAASLSR